MDQTTIKYPSLVNVYHDLTLFFKVQQNLPLALSDFTKIAEGRWSYFVTNWDFVKAGYLSRINGLPKGPGKVAAGTQYVDFSNLIASNRASTQNPLANPDNLRKFKDLFDNIYITDIPVNQSEQKIISDEIQRIVQLGKDDFIQMRERVVLTHDKITDSMGIGDPNYNALVGRVSGSKIITFQFSDFPVISSLVDLMNTITSMIPAAFVQNELPDPFLNIRKSLNNPDIPMDSYETGTIVPFPAGSTLQRVSQTYLGSPDRWLEIAVANGLQFPYVDETGKRAFMTVNGSGNLATLSIDEANSFQVNDEVFLGSDAFPLSRRTVQDVKVDQINGQVVLTLDGEGDLSKYTTAQRAYVFYYARNTVNSSKFIMIPNAQGTNGFKINAEVPWFVQTLPQDQRNLGVDLALSPEGDLVFNSTGDFQLIYGLANATQAASMKLNVKTGELMSNPSFGMEEIAGQYLNNEITTTLLTLIIESALGGDDRFAGTSGLGYTITNTATFVSASIKLAGSESSIPLTFTLPKG